MEPLTVAASLASAVRILLATFDLYEQITGVDIPAEVRELVQKIRNRYEPTAREVLAALELLGVVLVPAARNHLDAIARANEGHDAAADIRRARLSEANNELVDKPANQTEEESDNG